MQNNSLHNDDNFSIRIKCPICAKSGRVYVSKGDIKNSGKGLSTILIEKSNICDHKYLIYIDIEGHIRGTQTPDYELKFTPEDDKRDLSYKPGIEILALFYDEEIFCKLFRTAFLYNEICIITENNLLINLKIIFGKIFGINYMQKVVFTSLDEYNEKHRKRLLNSEFQNYIIINLDHRTIIKQPYDKDFQKKNFKLEMSILNDVKEHTLNHEIIIETLKSKYDHILDAIMELKGFIEKKVLSNRSKIDEWIKKLLIKKLDINAEIIYEILRNRFNIIVV